LLQREESPMRPQAQEIEQVLTNHEVLTTHSGNRHDHRGTLAHHVLLDDEAKVDSLAAGVREGLAVKRRTERVPALVQLLVEDQPQAAEAGIKPTGEAPGGFLVELPQSLEQRVIDTHALPRHRLASGGSGKEAALPSPPPLRTVRAPFNAYGSSLCKRL